MKRKIILLLTVGMTAAMLAGCGGQHTDAASGAAEQTQTAGKTAVSAEEETVSAKQKSVDETSANVAAETEITVDGWTFSLEDNKLDHNFGTISEELGYTSATTKEVSYEAADGKNYYMLKLLITKDGSTDEIDWENMTLVDENGNSYSRIDDMFITELGMKRIQSTNLNFGSYEGWICFEVDEAATQFTLQYAFPNETMSLSVQ